jgi:hypothetical protein
LAGHFVEIVLDDTACPITIAPAYTVVCTGCPVNVVPVPTFFSLQASVRLGSYFPCQENYDSVIQTVPLKLPLDSCNNHVFIRQCCVSLYPGTKAKSAATVLFLLYPAGPGVHLFVSGYFCLYQREAGYICFLPTRGLPGTFFCTRVHVS